MKRIVIIGGGASGIFAAIRLADICKNTAITIAEKNDRIGKKLLSTGNGKCNITNRFVSPAVYESDFGKIVEKYNYDYTLSVFASLGLPVKSDAAGRCYPLSESAGNCLNIFLAALAARGICIKTEFEVKHIKKKGKTFFISGPETLEADAVLLACGSAAGVRGYNGIDLLNNLGLHIKKPAPALCPLPSDAPFLKELKGARAKATLTLNGHSEAGEVQFNENGISGICAFNLARYLQSAGTLFINFNSENLPCETLRGMLETKPHSAVQNAQLLDFLLVRKIAFVLLKQAGLKPSGSPATLTQEALDRLVQLITAFPVPVTPPTDFKSAQTVAGGLNAGQICPDTLQAKTIDGLFVSGELLDAHGPCGGFNLQWAWSSALCAADAMKEYLENRID